MWAHPCGGLWVDFFLRRGEMKAEWLGGLALEPTWLGSLAGLGVRPKTGCLAVAKACLLFLV